MTGYPSIDKPWLKYYSDEAINAEVPQCTVYEYLYKNNVEYKENIALTYFKRRITYSELLKNIDKVANALSAYEINVGDIVTRITVTTPEIVYAFYEINKIGAISNWLDLKKSVEEVRKILIDTKTKFCFILDNLLERFKKVLDELNLYVIVIYISDSLPFLPKLIMSFKNIKTPNSERYITYKNFVEKYEKLTNVR